LYLDWKGDEQENIFRSAEWHLQKGVVMKEKLLEQIDRMGGSLGKKIEQGMSRRQTIGLSLVLHLSVALVFASLHVQKIVSIPVLRPDPSIEIELVTENQLDPLSDQSNSTSTLDGPNQNSNEMIPKSGERMGLASSDSDVLVAEQVEVSKEAVLMASLADLSSLRESFNFSLNQVSADSSGAFVPLSGEAPDTGYISDGIDGFGHGGRYGVRVSSGSGGGNCPGGGGILK
jgi:hypothetical protein